MGQGTIKKVLKKEAKIALILKLSADSYTALLTDGCQYQEAWVNPQLEAPCPDGQKSSSHTHTLRWLCGCDHEATALC